MTQLVLNIENQELTDTLKAFSLKQKKTMEEIAIEAIQSFIGLSKKKDKIDYPKKDILLAIQIIKKEFDESLCDDNLNLSYPVRKLKLSEEEFVGMWSNFPEMQDSTEWVNNKRQPKITKGDKTINPSELFGLWADQPRNLAGIRKQAWQRSGLNK